jgi:hypothetical protein
VQVRQRQLSGRSNLPPAVILQLLLHVRDPDFTGQRHRRKVPRLAGRSCLGMRCGHGEPPGYCDWPLERLQAGGAAGQPRRPALRNLSKATARQPARFPQSCLWRFSRVPVRAPRGPDLEEPGRQRCGDAGQRRRASERAVSVCRSTAPDLPFRGREHARRTSGALAAAMPSLAPKLHWDSSSKLYHKRGIQSKLETGVSSDDTSPAFGR